MAERVKGAFKADAGCRSWRCWVASPEDIRMKEGLRDWSSRLDPSRHK
jgi:hypothetical protein